MKRLLKSDIHLLYQYIKAGWQVMRTAVLIRTRLHQPVVTIFGSSLAKENDKYYHQSFELAKLLADNGFSILTGGGPGIMSAANCGALASKKNDHSTLGIGVAGVNEDYISRCGPFVRVSQFFGRKWLLIRYSSAVIVFPGGIGTMDELFELLNACKHDQIKQIPIVLIGSHFWQPIKDWYVQSTACGYISHEHEQLLFVTDDVNRVASMLKNKTHQE